MIVSAQSGRRSHERNHRNGATPHQDHVLSSRYRRVVTRIRHIVTQLQVSSFYQAIMSSLLDQIDRFSYTAQAIKSASVKVSQDLTSLYVRAVLETPLGDLARDVDPSELGLFTLSAQTGAVSDTHVPSSDITADDANAAVQRNEVSRVEFLGATPLRRPPPGQRMPEKEKEPEIYAEAALKYLDR